MKPASDSESADQITTSTTPLLLSQGRICELPPIQSPFESAAPLSNLQFRRCASSSSLFHLAGAHHCLAGATSHLLSIIRSSYNPLNSSILQMQQNHRKCGFALVINPLQVRCPSTSTANDTKMLLNYSETHPSPQGPCPIIPKSSKTLPKLVQRLKETQLTLKPRINDKNPSFKFQTSIFTKLIQIMPNHFGFHPNFAHKFISTK